MHGYMKWALMQIDAMCMLHESIMIDPQIQIMQFAKIMNNS